MSLINQIGKAMPLFVTDAFSMAGKVVIVTGGAGNIGSSIAEVFAANQSNVILSDLPGEKLTGVGDSLRSQYPSIIDTPADLNKPEELKVLVDQTVQRFGRIDVIINCGAIPTSAGISDENVPDFDRLYHPNVRAPWLLTKYAMEPMTQTGGGSIINIASLNGHRAVFFCALYAGTKSALLAMTRELAVELAPRNIRVNSVSPGFIPKTNHRLEWMNRHLAEPYISQLRNEFEPQLNTQGYTAQPLQMTGHGHDIGMACYYLSSPAARFVTGIDIMVDGGKTIEMPQAEPRFAAMNSIHQALRARLLELPEEAWIGEKPQWVQQLLATKKSQG